jgi:hypothetical protein
VGVLVVHTAALAGIFDTALAPLKSGNVLSYRKIPVITGFFHTVSVYSEEKIEIVNFIGK